MSYNAFLINTGRKLVLIDTGTGGKLDEDPGFHGCGHVLANLRAAGYEPSQVDEIYISHCGPDHVGGLTLSAGGRAFPNAIVRAASAEVDVYVDPKKTAEALAKATDKTQAKSWFDLQYALFSPYIKAGNFQTFQGDVTLSPGIRSLATPGHTPGHTSYIVESHGQTLIVMGDLVHWVSVQFRYPRTYTVFDADRKESIEQRLRVFQMAADGDDWIAGAHLPFPGIGHVWAGEGRYYWIPVNYTIPQ